MVRSRVLLALPSLLFALGLLGIPLIFLVCYSFWLVDVYDISADWNLGNYSEVIHRYPGVLLHTFAIGIEVAFFTTLAALPLAYALRFKMGKAQGPCLFVLLIAMFSGYLVRIYAWRIILGDSGILNSTLIWAGIVKEPLQLLLFSRLSLIITQMGFLLPLAVLPIYSALQNLPRERLDASHDLGAGRVETLFRVVMPEIAMGTAIAFSLSMTLAAGDFITPSLVGGPNGLMVGQAIARQFGTAFDWPLGSALAICTGVVTIALVVIVLSGASHLQNQKTRSIG